MPDFSKEGFYSPDKAFTSVKFGADAPLLEVELNELQKIQSNKVNVLTRSVLSNGFLNLPKFTYVKGILEVQPFNAVIDGNIIEVKENMILEVADGQSVYLTAKEVEVSYNDTIYKYGNLSGGTKLEENGIVDPRVGAETTKRTQLQVEITTKNDKVGQTYLPIGVAKMVEDAGEVRFTSEAKLSGFDPVIFKNAFEKEGVIFDDAIAVSPKFVELGNVVMKNYAEQNDNKNTIELLHWMGV